MDVDFGMNLEHLQALLARLDVLIRKEIWRWQQAGQDPRDPYRGLYLSDGGASILASRAPFVSWGQSMPPEPQGMVAFDEAYQQADLNVAQVAHRAQEAGIELRLEQTGRRFGLTYFELNVLLLCLAPTLDLRYERLYGFLQDDMTRKAPSASLAMDLLCGPGPNRLGFLPYFDPEAALFRHGLVERVIESGARSHPLGQGLRISETMAAWIAGRYVPQTTLPGALQLIEPAPSEQDRLLGNMIAGQADRFSAQDDLILAFYGADRSAQRSAGRLLAEKLGMRLLVADLAELAASGLTGERAAWLALRDARLTGALPFLAGWDACLPAGGSPIPPAEIIALLAAHPGLVITSGKAPWHWEGLDAHRVLFPFEFGVPNYGQRMALWAHFLGDDNPQIPLVASQYRLTSAQIWNAANLARDMAAMRGESIRPGDLFAAAQVHSNPNLISLARKITPRYGRADIVLPPDRLVQLDEIINTVRYRAKVLEQWGVGRKLAASQGITMLFIGSPGTGKTMAAEIIASELGLELYKIDLSSVVSKYIGETEKNLEKIFEEASSSNAILFFDEADALFGKRSEVKDAHDRYANIEISYLLQRMEAYDGVTILATNLRANLDEAFLRRLQFVVDFPFPEEADRRKIWETLFPPELPRDPQVDLGLMAQKYKLAGGHIRNILVSAAYLAAADGGAVTMDHLLHSARRELQKMGRLVN